MKRILTVAVLLAVIAALIGALWLHWNGAKTAPATGRTSQHQPSPTLCPATWRVVDSPNESNFPNSGLWGVAPVSATDVWAVGVAGNERSGGQSLIEHWDGSQWQIVPNPNPSSIFDILYGAAAISANNVWAVGMYGTMTGTTQTLIEHWDGSQWSVVASPNPGSLNNEFLGVSAVSANDIWAVGFITNIVPNQTPSDHALIEHWNGTRWSVMATPGQQGNNDHLEGVAAVSSSDVWAVGTSVTSGQTLVEHWDGSHWSVVASPNVYSGGDLRDVAAVSSSDVWAVGYDVATSGQTLAEHWNGSQWQVASSPNVGTDPNFSAVAAISSSDVWAVGYSFDSAMQFQTLAEQWNSTQWSVVTSPNSSTGNSQLIAVAALSASNVWAVGHGNGVTLIEHYACE
jgi:hypothetical protein